MQEDIANLVHPVISYGLRLKERLEKKEAPDLDTEQAALKGQLLTDMEARRWADFGGEAGLESRGMSVGRTSQNPDAFLGIRYALVCWLDEIFIVDSPWGREWNEQKLETALYGTNIRANLFWEQAQRAESRPGSDALEVYFLCVMLGFRGEYRDMPDKLQEWVTRTQARLAKSQSAEWTSPAEHEAPTNVPPRHARESLQRMLLFLGIEVLLIALGGAWFVMTVVMK